MHALRSALCIAGLLVLATSLAACDSGGGEALSAGEEGKLAPESATMKWEQEIPRSTVPAHVIRRYILKQSPGTILRFYSDELRTRGWTAAEGNAVDYAEWTKDGMVISFVSEPPSTEGVEWSLALFEAD